MPAVNLRLSLHGNPDDEITILVPIRQDKDSFLSSITNSFLTERSPAGTSYEFVIEEADSDIVLDPGSFYTALAPFIAPPRYSLEIQEELQASFGPCVMFEPSGRAQVTARIRLLKRES